MSGRMVSLQGMSLRGKCLRSAARVVCAGIALATIAGHPASSARAESAEEFFRTKKELNFITSSAVGGGYDSYSRLLARYLSKYLPGNPNVIVQNMIGGGGIRAANYIYNVAPKDGTVLSLIDRGMPTAPLLYGDKSNTRFDAVKFSWIGSLMRETGMGVIAERSKVKTIQDAKVHEIFFGSTGPETDPAMYARLVNDLLHTKIKVINGYKGQPEQFQSIEKGELDGTFMSGWSGPGRAYILDRMSRGEMRLLLQMAEVGDPRHPETPTLLDLVSSPDDRAIVGLVMNRMALGRPVIAPPDVPADRVALLRTAFWQAVEDPQFRADANTQRLAIDPMPGDQAVKVISDLYSVPPQVVERLRKIVQVSAE